MGYVISIDGPAGSGTSSTARQLATRCGLECLNTGSIYRAGTVYAMMEGVDVFDAEACAELMRGAVLGYSGGDVSLIGGYPVSREFLEAPAVEKFVPVFAEHPGVRDEVRNRQHQKAKESERGIVIEGRDIGTTVFPDALLKVWLDATPEERAFRHSDSKQRPVTPEALAVRDQADRDHKHGPMAKPDGALEIDTTDINTGQVVSIIEKELVKRSGSGHRRPGPAASLTTAAG